MDHFHDHQKTLMDMKARFGLGTQTQNDIDFIKKKKEEWKELVLSSGEQFVLDEFCDFKCDDIKKGFGVNPEVLELSNLLLEAEEKRAEIVAQIDEKDGISLAATSSTDYKVKPKLDKYEDEDCIWF